MAGVDAQRYRFSVDAFARSGEAGIFTEDDRVDLNRLIVTRLGDKAYMSIQNSIRLGRHTEPQPDLVVARLQDTYADRQPEPGDLLLLVVIGGADSSLRNYRMEKAPRYGKAGIPETWLVDVAAGTVTVYNGPGPEGYATEQVLQQGGEITATGVPGLGFPVGEIFG